MIPVDARRIAPCRSALRRSDHRGVRRLGTIYDTGLDGLLGRAANGDHRFDSARSDARSWVATIAHRRAVSAPGQLSAPQREVLELASYGGLSHAEVADQLGIALGTATTRIRDGVLRLRTVLGEEARR